MAVDPWASEAGRQAASSAEDQAAWERRIAMAAQPLQDHRQAANAVPAWKTLARCRESVKSCSNLPNSHDPSSATFNLAEEVRKVCQRCEALEREVATWKAAYESMVREWKQLARQQEQSNG